MREILKLQGGVVLPGPRAVQVHAGRLRNRRGIESNSDLRVGWGAEVNVSSRKGRLIALRNIEPKMKVCCAYE